MEKIANLHEMSVTAWLQYFTKHYPSSTSPATLRKMFYNVRNANAAANIIESGQSILITFLDQEGHELKTLRYATLTEALEAGRASKQGGFILNVNKANKQP